MNWEKIDHFTGEPYKKDQSGAWRIVDYICGGYKIQHMFDGHRSVTFNGRELGRFKTLKAAKSFVEETIAE